MIELLIKTAELAEDLQLYPHQLRAVEKFLKHGNLVMAHGVGSGKTIGSIASFETAKKLGSVNRALVIVPAGLRQNYADSIEKFTKGSSWQVVSPKNETDAADNRVRFDRVRPNTDYTVVSYEMFLRDPEGLLKRTGADTLVLDEFQRARGSRSKTFDAVMRARPRVKAFMGLTGSLLNNDPSDIVPLLRISTNDQIPIHTRKQFEAVFKQTVGKERGFFGGTKKMQALSDLNQAKTAFGPYLDMLETEDIPGASLPAKNLEVVKVDMSPEQKKYYQYAMGELPWITRFKIKHNIPMDKREVRNVFQKIIAARQVSNSVHTLNKNVTPSEAAKRTPKVKTMLEDVEEHLRATPDGQAVVYTNLVHGGADVAAAGLKDLGIPFGVFIGKGREVAGTKSTDEQRTKDVDKYNAGELKVLLISGAGAEGLSLPNTTFVATMDGHFNPERILQAEARGRRIGGQAHRAPEERKVTVRRYMSVIPRNWFQKLFGSHDQSVEEWVYDVAGKKATMNSTFRDIFENPEDDDRLTHFAEKVGLKVREYKQKALPAPKPEPRPAPIEPEVLPPAPDPRLQRPVVEPQPKIPAGQATPAPQPPVQFSRPMAPPKRQKHYKYVRKYQDPMSGRTVYVYPEDVGSGSAVRSLSNIKAAP